MKTSTFELANKLNQLNNQFKIPPGKIPLILKHKARNNHAL